MYWNRCTAVYWLDECWSKLPIQASTSLYRSFRHSTWCRIQYIMPRNGCPNANPSRIICWRVPRRILLLQDSPTRLTSASDEVTVHALRAYLRTLDMIFWTNNSENNDIEMSAILTPQTSRCRIGPILKQNLRKFRVQITFAWSWFAGTMIVLSRAVSSIYLENTNHYDRSGVEFTYERQMNRWLFAREGWSRYWANCGLHGLSKQLLFRDASQ